MKAQGTLRTQEVYTRTTKANPQKPNRNNKTQTPETEEKPQNKLQ
jgi:hypothetical protein